MSAMPQALFDDLTEALTEADRLDLVERLRALRPRDVLTSSQAAELLGVSSPNTVKNWLKGGAFPGAFQTPGGHWRFPREEVEAVKTRMDDLRERNRRGDLLPPDDETNESEEPPLLGSGPP